MIASLDELYHSNSFPSVMDENASACWFLSIATFAAEDGAVRMPTELVAPHILSVEEQYCLFVEKLALLETCQHFYSA